MQCSCKTELTIKSGEEVYKDGKKFWRQIFTCLNPNCPNYQKEVHERMIRMDEADAENHI